MIGGRTAAKFNLLRSSVMFTLMHDTYIVGTLYKLYTSIFVFNMSWKEQNDNNFKKENDEHDIKLRINRV